MPGFDDGVEKTPIWKKEISFRRQPKREGAAAAAPPSTSIWKKEISLGRRKQAPSEPVAAASEPAPFVAADPVSPVSSSAVEPSAIEHDWLTAPLEDISLPPEEPVVLAAVPAEPAPNEPAANEPAPNEPVSGEHALELVPEPVTVLPPLVETPVPASIHPPVPAAELPPEPAASPTAKVPFYKREISLGRPKATQAKPEKVAKPKAEKPQKVAKAKAEKPQKVAKPKAEKTQKSPKRERRAIRLPRPRVDLTRTGGAKTIVGLKIGGSQIAAARVSNGGAPELLQAVREPLEHGIVVGGELRDPEALAAALKDFFRKHKLPKRGVRLGIANNRIGVRTFEIAGIDDPKQLANAIRFRAQEVLPIPIEEAVIDYQILSEAPDEDGRIVRRILLVVAYRDLVDRYVDACRQAGIQVIGIDLEAFALLRALEAPREVVALGDERGALVAVSVGHDRSTFAVSDGRVCEFTRVLEWGGWALNVAIARALDLSPSEAEPIKRSLSLAGPTEPPEGVGEEQLATAREAARRQLQSFARELVSSLQFYQNQPGSLSIGEVVLTGGTAHLPGLGAELERLIGVPVRIGDPLNRLKMPKRLREAEQVGSLAVAIGLGIED